mgnify:CR=1 FL=1
MVRPNGGRAGPLSRWPATAAQVEPESNHTSMISFSLEKRPLPTVDGEGKAMHKSLGNAMPPEEIIKDYGADMLRLWVASADYTQDMRISKEIMKQLSQAYLKIRNTQISWLVKARMGASIRVMPSTMRYRADWAEARPAPSPQ